MKITMVVMMHPFGFVEYLEENSLYYIHVIRYWRDDVDSFLSLQHPWSNCGSQVTAENHKCARSTRTIDL